MLTFFDLLKSAQGGQAFDNIAAVYGLKRGDLEALSTALLPAFQIGLQRTLTTSPSSMTDLLDPERFRAAFEDARAAASPAATEAGRMALERIFGSKEAAKVVAEQASAMSGVGADVVSKVMPTLAATLLGGLGKAIEDTPMQPLLKAWSGGVDPAQDPLSAMMTPWRNAMDAFLRGYAAGKPVAQAEEGAEWPEGMAAFGKMFEAGVDIGEQNRKAFEQILDQFRKPE
jgi:hypothetical protein